MSDSEDMSINRASLLRAHGSKALPIIDALESAIEAVDPVKLVRKSVHLENKRLRISGVNQEVLEIPISGRVFIVGGGKAAFAMASTLCDILGRLVECTNISVPLGSSVKRNRSISVTFANHPLPNHGSQHAAQKMIQTVRSAGPQDLIIAVISGGASSLIALPPENVTLQDKGMLTSQLLLSGATIDEINTVRKHLSEIKGGRLVRYKNRSTLLVALILSDVVGNDIGTVASGLTAPDRSTYQDARAILKKYRISAPSNVVKYISRGVQAEIPETPKPGDPIFDRVINLIIGDNTLACNAAISKLSTLGFKPTYLGSGWTGSALEFGNFIHSFISDLTKVKKSAIAVVAGGETTVNIKRGSRKGGRNQEAALSFACSMTANDPMVAGFLGTDGIDGNSIAAGGLVSVKTLTRRNRTLLLGDLEKHDSYNALRKTRSLIISGLTGTNVNDIAIAISNLDAARQPANHSHSR